MFQVAARFDDTPTDVYDLECLSTKQYIAATDEEELATAGERRHCDIATRLK